MESRMSRDCDVKSKIKRPPSTEMSANRGVVPTSRQKEKGDGFLIFTAATNFN